MKTPSSSGWPMESFCATAAMRLANRRAGSAPTTIAREAAVQRWPAETKAEKSTS